MKSVPSFSGADLELAKVFVGVAAQPTARVEEVLLSPALNDDQHPWQEKKSMADDGELYPMWNLQKE